MESKGAPRRRHGKALKAQVLAECSQPGTSVAAVALAHGLNANLVHKWRRGAGRKPESPARAVPVADSVAVAFVPLQLPQPAPATPPDIRIELRRGATSVTVSWPAGAAAECAAWMRELLR
jgi:transposase